MVSNQNDIDVIISKFLSGEADPEEAMFLEDWKDESAENLAYFRDSEKLFGFGGTEETLQKPAVHSAWEKIESQLVEKPKAKIFKLNPAFFRMAASMTILIGLAGFLGYYYLNSSKETQSYASTEITKDVRLKDGTGIVIASNSSVSLDAGFGQKNRKLTLKGSAYFTVTHDEKMPFIIDAGEIYIKDLGTKFNVDSKKDTLFVSVDEGIVYMYDKRGAETTLYAGESAFYLRKTHELVTHKAVVAKNIKFSFANKKLAEVIKNLNKAYDTQIELENNTLSDCTITTQFENEDLEMALTVITETLGLKFRQTEKGYIILGEKCKN